MNGTVYPAKVLDCTEFAIVEVDRLNTCLYICSLMLKHLIVIFLALIPVQLWAQTDSTPPPVTQPKPVIRKADSVKRVAPVAKPAADTIRRLADSAMVKPDSVKRGADTVVPVRQLTWQEDTLYQRLFRNAYLPIGKPGVFMISQQWVRESKDQLFYVLVGLLLILGFIRASFPKYFTYLFMLVRQTSFRQKQTREQLLQGRLPSLMMNILFLLVAGIFVSVVFTQKKITNIPFWYLVLYSILILAGVYLLKFLFLRFTGWVFRVSEAAETYIFIVFLVNKLMAVVLLPLVWLLAFSEGDFNVIVFTISTFIIVLMLLYRYILALAAVRNMVRVSPFHFFIYLCAVEILPVLLIYKVVFSKMGLSI